MSRAKQLAEALVKVDEETLNKIDLLEKEGKFNEHTAENSVDFIPVGEDYEYIPKGFFKKIDGFFKKIFIINPFMRHANKLFKTEVTGRENLKGIKNAVICANHVNKLDCMAIRKALLPHKTYFTAAEFNNMDSFLGDMMRLGGMLPMSDDYGAMKKLLSLFSELLSKGNYVTFFPEGSEWWCYEKPRPHRSGAYHVAVKNNVPIIPVFITFKETEESLKDRTGLKQFVVNILKPIYPDKNLGLKENVKFMTEEGEKAWKQKYTEFYGKDL